MGFDALRAGLVNEGVDLSRTDAPGVYLLIDLRSSDTPSAYVDGFCLSEADNPVLFCVRELRESTRGPWGFSAGIVTRAVSKKLEREFEWVKTCALYAVSVHPSECRIGVEIGYGSRVPQDIRGVRVYFDVRPFSIGDTVDRGVRAVTERIQPETEMSISQASPNAPGLDPKPAPVCPHCQDRYAGAFQRCQHCGAERWDRWSLVGLECLEWHDWCEDHEIIAPPREDVWIATHDETQASFYGPTAQHAYESLRRELGVPEPSTAPLRAEDLWEGGEW